MLELASILIRTREGFNSTPFEGENGWVIGYGRDLNQGISEEEAEILLYTDLDNHINELMSYRFWDSVEATSPRKAALVAIHYSIGARAFHGLTRFTTALDEDDWVRAARELTAASGKLGLKSGKSLSNLIRMGEE